MITAAEAKIVAQNVGLNYLISNIENRINVASNIGELVCKIFVTRSKSKDIDDVMQILKEKGYKVIRSLHSDCYDSLEIDWN